MNVWWMIKYPQKSMSCKIEICDLYELYMFWYFCVSNNKFNLEDC